MLTYLWSDDGVLFQMMPRGQDDDGSDIGVDMWMHRKILPLMDVDVARFRTLDDGGEDHMDRNRWWHAETGADMFRNRTLHVKEQNLAW